jgi:hypothetical protein
VMEVSMLQIVWTIRKPGAGTKPTIPAVDR